VNDDLVEWNYGSYGGKKAGEIQRLQHGWQLFESGCGSGTLVFP
jgi:broad specificity phosphatase PhoE